MIINIGPVSIWSGIIPIAKNLYFPRLTYFNGGCYWKIGFRWFRYLLEFSGSKKDSKCYNKVTSKELNVIIEKISKY